jgi:hypothetical protein
MSELRLNRAGRRRCTTAPLSTRHRRTLRRGARVQRDGQDRGGTVKAFISVKEGEAADPDEVAAFKERIAAYKYPRVVGDRRRAAQDGDREDPGARAAPARAPAGPVAVGVGLGAGPVGELRGVALGARTISIHLRSHRWRRVPMRDISALCAPRWAGHWHSIGHRRHCVAHCHSPTSRSRRR